MDALIPYDDRIHICQRNRMGNYVEYMNTNAFPYGISRSGFTFLLQKNLNLGSNSMRAQVLHSSSVQIGVVCLEFQIMLSHIIG